MRRVPPAGQDRVKDHTYRDVGPDELGLPGASDLLTAIYRKATTMSEPASVSRRIDASAGALFAILTDPALHPEIDGSGMLREPHSGAAALSAVGDVFALRMHNDVIGDYVMTNTVVEYEPGRRITWAPLMTESSHAEGKPLVGVSGGHRWGYELRPDGDGCVVTEIADFSGALEWLREATNDGKNWIPAMTESLERLARLAAARSGH